MPNKDTELILKAITTVKEDLTKKIDENHTDLKKTLYGIDGIGGIVQSVQTLHTVVCGVPNVSKGLIGDVDNLKNNQNIWNKSLGGSQIVTWGILAIKQLFGV